MQATATREISMTDTNNIPDTTAEGLDRARVVFRGDWDEQGVTAVHLPTSIAQKALTNRGWHRGTHRRGPGLRISPSGHRVWDTDEALRMAIAAETLSADADA